MAKPSHRRSLNRIKSRIASRNALALWADRFRRMANAAADATWGEREEEQGWQNVMRLNSYLAKRRVLAAGGDPNSVRVFMPTLGPKATPELVMKSLIQIDAALRDGDFEEVEFTHDDDAVSLGTPAISHEDTTVGPYDGPGRNSLVLAGNADGTNMPSPNAATLLERAQNERARDGGPVFSSLNGTVA